MKKILLASSAVAMFAAGAASAAEPVAVTVGGYAFFGVGFKDVDPGTQANSDGFGIMRDGEIHFNVRGTSDNGLTFSGRVELEAWTQAGDQIDENWFQVSGAFGSVKVGGDDHASYNLATGVFFFPGAKIGHYDDFGEANPAGTYMTNNRFSDTLGLFYRTPNIAGFLAEVSYHPTSGIDGVNDSINMVTSSNRAVQDVFSFGLNYGQTFDDFSIRLSGGYDIVGSTPAGPGGGSLDDDGWMAGAQFGFGGFALGGHFKQGLVWLGGASEEYVVNASYTTGPWYMMAGFTYGDKLANVSGDDVMKYTAGVRYSLAPGVTTTAALEYTDADVGGVSQDGIAGMAYLQLSF